MRKGNGIADTTAENIDIKEGTTGGKIIGNHLGGTGMVDSAAAAWIDVKGDDRAIRDNTGIGSIGDGFQVGQVYPGWGIGNVFRDNHAVVDGPGYGIHAQGRAAADGRCLRPRRHRRWLWLLLGRLRERVTH